MDMNNPDCESLFNEITKDFDKESSTSVITEINNIFNEKVHDYYYNIMDTPLNSLNTCGKFLKIFRNTDVLDYIDNYLTNIFNQMTSKFIDEDCNSTGTTINELKINKRKQYITDIFNQMTSKFIDKDYNSTGTTINELKINKRKQYIDDMRRKLVNYYKFLCVNQYLEKFEIPPDNGIIPINKNLDAENIYYLELSRNIQKDTSNINTEDNVQVFYEMYDAKNKKTIEYYNSRGFLCLGRFGIENNNYNNDFLEYIKLCLGEKYSEISDEYINDEYIKNNLWKVKTRPTSQKKGGKQKTMRNKKIQRNRKTVKRAKMRRTRHRKRVNSRHSKK